MAITRLGPNQDITAAKIAGQINFKNLIINGDMSIAQRGTSSTSSDFATIDRNNILFGTVSVTQSQTTDVPSNYTFNNSFKLNVDTPSSATSANAQMRQIIEAQMIRSSSWDYTSSSSYLTLSFWVKCSLVGTYYAVFRSEDGTQQSISKSYTINSANTWEKKTITIPGNSNITINNDTGRGLTVWFVFIAGTDNSGSSANLDSWGAFVSGNYTPDSSDAQTFLNTTNANISFTGVQLEAGTSASDFEFLPWDVNFSRCQRYYTRIATTGGNYPFAFGWLYGTTGGTFGLPVSVPMRTQSPSVSIIGTNNAIYSNGTIQTITSMGTVAWESNTFVIGLNTASLSHSLDKHPAILVNQAGTPSGMAFDAEL